MYREKLIEVVREIIHRPVTSIDKSARRRAADLYPIEHRPSLVGKRTVIRHGSLHLAGWPMRWHASSEPWVVGSFDSSRHMGSLHLHDDSDRGGATG